MNTSKVLPCSCQHQFQDSEYGQGMRLMGRTKQSEGEKLHSWRCTVCTKIHESSVPKSDVKEEKKTKQKKS